MEVVSLSTPLACASGCASARAAGGLRVPSVRPVRLHSLLAPPDSLLAPVRTPRRDETCPISTEGGTRRVQLVREGGGGGAPPEPRPRGVNVKLPSNKPPTNSIKATPVTLPLSPACHRDPGPSRSRGPHTWRACHAPAQRVRGRGMHAPPPCTKWTHRVPHPVLIGHAASACPRLVTAEERRARAPPRRRPARLRLQAPTAAKAPATRTPCVCSQHFHVRARPRGGRHASRPGGGAERQGRADRRSTSAGLEGTGVQPISASGAAAAVRQ